MFNTIRYGLRSLTVPACRSCRPCSTTATASLNITKVPLSKSLKDFPKIIYPKASSEDNKTKVTTLPNGLRVASVNRFGQFCTVGIVISSGPRFESQYPSGVSHFLEKLAFQSTTDYADRDAIWSDLEKHGGIVDCQLSRDCIIYAASIDIRGVDKAIKIISDTVLRPQLQEAEVNFARQVVLFELEDIASRPDQELILTELIHSAAYGKNTLGLPKLCPAENAQIIDRNLLMKFISAHYTPDRMVLAGVGIDHDKLVELSDKYFVQEKAIWESDATLANLTKGTVPEIIQSQYTGGMASLTKDLSNLNPGPSPMPELAHFVMGLEGCSHKNLDDFVPTCVLNMMMGGGGSFSAGGPGKGMYTRLYTNVLNRYHWMYNATAYNHAYSDSGIFCIYSSAHPSRLRDLASVIIKEMVAMAGVIDTQEFRRAKKQLQSMLLMNLEARPVVFEDIGRQVLENGIRRSPEFFIDAIDRVTEDDIRRVATKMLKSKASVAALGDLSLLPSLEDIDIALISKDGSVPRRYTLFR